MEIEERNQLLNQRDKLLDDLERMVRVATKIDAAVQRVRELHKPFGKEMQWCRHCEIGQVSGYDYAEYPCPTIKALDGEQ